MYNRLNRIKANAIPSDMFSNNRLCLGLVLLTFSFFVPAGIATADSDKFVMEQVAPISHPVEERGDADNLIEYLQEGDMVLLGEGSHGTREFYEWRAHISRKLIQEHDFDFIVVESDWPSHYELNRYVKGKSENIEIDELFETFDRWPPWMWRNDVIVELTQWLHSHNKGKNSPVGFYGMDVQDVSKSFKIIQEFLKEADHKHTDQLLEKLNCLQPYLNDVRSYVQRLAVEQKDCRENIQKVHNVVVNEILPDMELTRAETLDIERNLSLLVHGESRWRAHIVEELNNWNIRVKYMHETVNALREHYGEDSQGIVWAHNTHVGDARATRMAEQGRLNIGQLMREELGADRTRILGFGTARGKVKAGSDWGESGEIMQIPEPVDGSVESIFSNFDADITLIKFYESEREEGPVFESIGHRAIGVVYQPEREHLGNYVPTVLPKRYDAFLFFQETNALEEWDGTSAP